MSISISVGPWGGKGGDPWDDKVNGGIRQIILKYDRVIYSINIEYEKDGSYVWSMHGGNGGNQIGKIELEYPKERIISITGHYDDYLRSLTFQSNTKKYGPYGVQEGTYFSFTMAGGKIVGFYGRSGWYLDGIGVHISNLQPQSLLSPLKVISVGPWGGKGGDRWDDGVYEGIHQIILVHGQVIDSISIKYENDGKHVWSKHGGLGGLGGNKTDKIQLDYPRENLTLISGHYDNCLKSLAFESNLRKYGPYGVQHGTYFSFPLTTGKIVSFHGRSGWYLDCIGVYLSN